MGGEVKEETFLSEKKKYIYIYITFIQGEAKGRV